MNLSKPVFGAAEHPGIIASANNEIMPCADEVLMQSKKRPLPIKKTSTSARIVD